MPTCTDCAAGRPYTNVPFTHCGRLFALHCHSAGRYETVCPECGAWVKLILRDNPANNIPPAQAAAPRLAAD